MSDGRVQAKVWDFQTDEVTLAAEFDSEFEYLVAVSNDEKQMLVGGGKMAVWLGPPVNLKSVDLASGKIELVPGHLRSLSDIAYSPNDKLFATAGSDRSIRLWDRNNSEELACWKPQADDRHRYYFAGDLDFSESGKWLAAVYLNGTVLLFDTQTKALTKTFVVDYQLTSQIQFIENDQTLCISSRDSNRVILLDISSGKVRSELPLHQQNIRSLDQQGSVVITAGEAGSVLLHRVPQSK